MSTATAAVRDIQAGIGKGFLQRLFGGRTFIQCLVELLKNSRDWGASMIWIATAVRTQLRILDDGRGMNAANRNAFASINLTTAKAGQAGRFDTGTKWMLFSQATHVRVVTVSDEEPDWVYIFEFGTDEYEQLALSGGTITPRREPKTTQNWPHAFATGTEITYTLRNPSRSGILRGAKLAEELAARLPYKLKDHLRVDEAELPEKQIVGQVFRLSQPVEALGEVTVEVYRPRHRRPEEDLRVTGVEVGEAPFGYLVRLLSDRLRDEVPTLYLLPMVCGTLAASYLTDYAREDRMSLDAAVADDPRTAQLVRLLARLAPAIARALQIKEVGTGAVPDDRELHDLREVCARKYGRATSPDAPGPGEEGPGGGGNGGGGGANPDQDPIILKHPSEVARGETFEVTAHLRRGQSSGHTVDELRWTTARARSRVDLQEPGRLRLTATEVGHGVVAVDLPGTLWHARAHFEVVDQRTFKLSVTHARVRIGGAMFITAMNTDLLPGEGEVDWELDGTVCTLRPEGKRVWVDGVRRGVATLHAYARGDRRIHASCDLTVVGQEVDLLRIREHLFEVRPYAVPDDGQNHAPVQMLMGSGKVHTLTLNTSARGLLAARKQEGGLLHVAQVVAAEYARFCHFDLAHEVAALDPRELRTVQMRLAAEADEVFAELMEALESVLVTA